MPDCSQWGGKYCNGQSLRAITNGLKLFKWVHLRNVNHISHMQGASKPQRAEKDQVGSSQTKHKV
mgnify:CR=1 FL=1